VLVADNQVNLTDREVEKFYKDHESDFERPASARVKFVVIDRTPNAADTAAARARALGVRDEIAKGAKFEDVAKRESADSVSAAEGGNLGKITKGMTVPAFEQAVFSLPLNQLSQPVQTNYGFHIIQVQSRTANDAEARHILIPIRPSTEREEQILTMTDSLEALSANRSLDEAARTLGLTVRTAEVLPGLTFLPGVGQSEDASIWVFEQAELNEISNVFDTPNASFMLQLVNKTEKGTLTLQEASQTIRSRLLQQKKLEEARQIARRALDRVRSGGTLDQAAQAVGQKVQDAGPFTRLDFVPGLGRANAAIGTAFGLKQGRISDIVEAEGGLFIIQSVERVDANRAEFEKQKEEQRQRIADAMAQQRWSQYLQAVRREAKIEDNRETVLTRGTATATTN
jgi:peptidyl-prolyl cis-trans isomerase D